MVKHWQFWIGILLFLGRGGMHTYAQDPVRDSLDHYNTLRNYKKSLQFARLWEAQVKKSKGEKNALYGDAVYYLGMSEFNMDLYPEAEAHLLRSIKIRKKTRGAESVEMAQSVAGLGQYWFGRGQYKTADSLHEMALKMRVKLLPKNHKDIGLSYLFLSNVAGRLGDLTKAVELGEQGTGILLKAVGVKSPEYWIGLNTLGFLYQEQARYKDAERLYREALDHELKDTVTSIASLGNTYNNLGGMYWETGNYKEAERYLTRSMDIFKKRDGENSQNVAMLLCNLGLLNSYTGNYPKAEKYLLRSAEIYQGIHGEEYSILSTVYNNLGLIYLDLGNLEKAEAVFTKAMNIAIKTRGEMHEATGTAMTNLAQTLEVQKRYRESEKYYLRSIGIMEKNYGDNHPKTAAAYLHYSNRCQESGKLALAEEYLKKAYQIHLKILGENNYESALNLVNLASVYMDMGQYTRASEFLQRAFKGFSSVVGKDNLIFHHLYKLMGISEMLEGKTASALEKYRKDNKNLFNQIERYFPTLSETEKSRFFESMREDFENFNSFGISRYRQDPSVAGDMYNLQLVTKSLLLNSTGKWKQRIRSSGDKKLFARYTQWEELQTQLGEAYKSTDPADSARTDSLEAETEKLEKELSARSENFARMSDKQRFTWHDVQKKLKPGEAAIEMIRVRRYGLQPGLADSSDPKQPVYRKYGTTDTVEYAALVVLAGNREPRLIRLRQGNLMEEKWLAYYQNCIRSRVEDADSYSRFWKPIFDQIPGVKRIYFSPDGIYHSLNINTLYNPKSKKYVLDETDIRLLTTTKDLLRRWPEENLNQLAYIIGYPDYGMTQHDLSTTLESQRGDDLSPLPGTEKEANQIAALFSEQNWEVVELMREKAMEDALKELYKPKVLHIATHGFFYPDTGQNQNPLVRSGLFLAGAANTLKGKKNEMGDDGVLTAYEAMNLNLDNTELVVLSACETGKGEIRNGEGVFGLQRAFQVAGAKSLVMSLWKVNDATTQTLMVSFYKHWVSPPATIQRKGEKAPFAGLGAKRSAFLAAQREIKARFPHPYFWGAFVMVGE